MKNKKIALLVFLLFVLFTNPELTLAGSLNGEPTILHSIFNSAQTQFTILITTLVSLLAFGFQMAKSQNDEVYDEDVAESVREYVLLLREIKKGAEDGTITSTWLQGNPYSDKNQAVKATLDLNLRQESIKRIKWQEKDEKILEREYAELAKSLDSNGVIYEAPVSPVFKFVLDEIIETIKTVDEFDPKSQRWTALWKWIWIAISPKERSSWAESFFATTGDLKPRFYKELDKLSVSFARKVRTIDPSDDFFANHNEAEENLIKEQLGDKVKVHKSGIENKNWEIEYDHHKNPVVRFKRGYAWGKHLDDDSGYCRLFQINLKQDHIGGGKYGDTYAVWLDSWPRACPDGKSNSDTKSKSAPTKPESKSKQKPKSK